MQAGEFLVILSEKRFIQPYERCVKRFVQTCELALSALGNILHTARNKLNKDLVGYLGIVHGLGVLDGELCRKLVAAAAVEYCVAAADKRITSVIK